VFTSDVVETVTSETETETWLKFRDRDCHKSRDRYFVIKAETETWKFETETRDLTFMVIKTNSWNNAATKYLANCQIPR